MLEKTIRNLFLTYPQVLYGFTDTSYSAYADAYRSALIFAVPYGVQLTLETYTEEAFEKGIQNARNIVDEILSKLEKILTEQNVKYYIPPVTQNNETDLEAPFSFKFAAVNAGLGWIGKNDVVITKRYGPRVRLSAILIAAPFVYGDKITESLCPQTCRNCIAACPHKVLRGVRWQIDSVRSDLIDYRLCNEKRSLSIKTLGRKHACGLCMAACPFGTETNKTQTTQ